MTRSFAVMLACLLFVGCNPGGSRQREAMTTANRQECVSKGGWWMGAGAYDMDGPCFAIDSIIPLAGEPRP